MGEMRVSRIGLFIPGAAGALAVCFDEMKLMQKGVREMVLKTRGWSKSLLVTLLFVLTVLGFGVSVRAQEPKIDADVRIERLEKSLAETRAELAAARSAGGGSARLEEVERKIEVLASEIEKMKIGDAAAPGGEEAVRGLGPAASKVYALSRGVSIGGYGEVLYQKFDSKRESGDRSGEKDRIDLQRAVFYFGYKFDEHFVFNSEIEYEHAVAASDKEGEVEAEFAYIDWTESRAFNLRGGLVLIPMGLINELHEPTVFLGSRRPEVDTVILPSTWRELGFGAYGESGPVKYRAYFVNGLNSAGYDAEEGIREGRQEGSLALAENWALTGRIDWTPSEGMLLGGSFFTGDSAQGAKTIAGRGFGARTSVYELHGDWKWRGLQARALWAASRISDAAAVNEANGYQGENGIGSRQEGWYVEAGFDVLSLRPGSRSSLIPFLRYETYDTQKRVPIGYDRNPANDRDILTVGINWKPIENIVIKADWQKSGNGARSGVDQWNVALGYIF